MQEKTTAPVIEPHSDGNLSDIPARNARQRPRHAAFARKIDSAWVDVTTTEFLTQVRAIAKGLMACGIEPGDRVALMSRTRYEWTLCDFAIWTAGAVTVPIYETSSAHQVDWILTDSAAKGIVTELDRHTQIVEEVRGNSEALQHVWQIEGGGLDGLVEAGKEVSDQDLDRRRSIATRDDLATIIYTSGTTGRPKGCELTHGNFMSLSENAIAKLPEVVGEEGARMVLFLPLAHVLARFIQVLAVDSGVKVGHAPDIKKLMDDLKGFQPTFVLAVPRVFEKIYNMTDQKLAAENKGRLFRLAAKIAIAHSRAMDEGGAGLPLKVHTPASSNPACREISYWMARCTERREFTFLVSVRVPSGTASCRGSRGSVPTRARRERLASQRSDPCSIRASLTPRARIRSRSADTYALATSGARSPAPTIGLVTISISGIPARL